MRTSASFFDDAMASLKDGGRIAICVGDKNKKCLLVQQPEEPLQYTIRYNQDVDPDGKPVTSNYKWNNDSATFYQVVGEVLDVDDLVSGTHSP